MLKSPDTRRTPRTGRLLFDLVCTLAIAGAMACATSPVRASTLNRPADPVVLTGADIPSLTGIAPEDLVAFRYDGGWVHIPVQVDERAIVNYNDVYDGHTNWGGNFTRLSYTDSGTFTGGDPDATLDDDDEIALMAKDAGAKPGTFSEPLHVIPGSGVEVAISDPVDAGWGYVYLFEQDGTLDPGAGVQYVDYQFTLLSGDYLTTYEVGSGWDPEDTTVTTLYYERHFSDRWICDGLSIYAGSATGVDILDRQKSPTRGPGSCDRTTDTYSEGEGAFVRNSGGPVRAIRSYVGCNSGPLTQRVHIYYERREDIATYLRVHAINSVADYFDYSPDAIGMTYCNNNNLAGVTIDGQQDAVTEGPVAWELVTGSHGSVVMVHSIDTDITTVTLTSVYLDDDDTAGSSSGDFEYQCTGDEFAYGSSGPWMRGSLPNTDPTLDDPHKLETFRYMYYEPPGLTVSDAEDRLELVTHPLTYTTGVCRDVDGDGVMECDDAFPGNPDEWADDDRDGLGDNFEQQIIDFDAFDAYETLDDVLPDDDFDRDGTSNATEFEWQTDPTDPASYVPLWTLVGTALLVAAALASALIRFATTKTNRS